MRIGIIMKKTLYGSLVIITIGYGIGLYLWYISITPRLLIIYNSTYVALVILLGLLIIYQQGQLQRRVFWYFIVLPCVLIGALFFAVYIL